MSDSARERAELILKTTWPATHTGWKSEAQACARLLLERVDVLEAENKQLKQDRDDERLEYQAKFYRMRDGLEARVDALGRRIDAIWELRNSDLPPLEVVASAINQALQARIESGRHL